ncbi:MAG: hypothetical protein AABZ39_03750 [Spirochaetota bacterium]
MTRYGALILVLLAVFGCVTPPRLTVDDSGFLARGTVIAVVPATDNLKAILAADQLRNYLVVNGEWRLLTKTVSEKTCYDREFIISPASIETSDAFTNNTFNAEAEISKLTSVKEVRYIITVRPLSVTTTYTRNTDSRGRSTTTETLAIEFDVSILASPSGTSVSKIKLSGNATTFFSGGGNLFLSDKNKASIVAIDRFIQNYARQAVDLQRNASR